MTRQEAAQQVRQAKSSHIRWCAYVQARIAGLEVEDGSAPLDHRQCGFGRWFYGKGFAAFGHWQLYQDVEYAHELLHAVYRLIDAALSAGEQARAAALAGQLGAISESLLKAIDLLEEEIQETSEEVL